MLRKILKELVNILLKKINQSRRNICVLIYCDKQIALDEEILKEANLEESETVFPTLTNDDENNIMACVLEENRTLTS